jgi:uroporphyrin-III C-methyltransferase/precorrin-2 dehydrogenase/sirohydrochlorin ferrochelatase
MHSLPIFVRLTDRPVILLGHGDGAEAKRILLNRAGARIVDESSQAQLAIVAIEDEQEALAAVERLRSRGILVNAVDRPQLCDFTIPSILERDPVLIAIGSGGASAGLVKALRQRLEAIIPTGLGRIATALGEARAGLRHRWPDATDRRRAIDAALSEGGDLDLLRSPDPEAVAEWISGSSGQGSHPTGVHPLEICSPDPDQLTLEQARLLGKADMIIYDNGIPDAVMVRGRADAVRVPASMVPDPVPDGVIVRLLWRCAQ